MRPAFLHVGGTLRWTILTHNPDSSVLKDADSTPTVAVRKNGSSVGDSVTITKRTATTGIYDCSYTPSGSAEQDVYQLEESATVTGTTTAQATYVQTWTCCVIAEERGTDLAALAAGVNVTQWKGSTAPDLVGGRLDASVGAYQSGLAPLQPTTAGRTVDITAAGNAGIDWGNIENPTANNSFSGSYIALQNNQNVLIAPGAITTTAIADGAFTSAKFASGAFDAVWSVTSRTLSGFGTLIADTWAYASRTLTGTVTLAASQPNYAPAVAGDAMTLTTGERTAVANEVEAQIIDDTDSERVLQAIVDKIAAVNPSLDDLTLGGIASAVRTELATELARMDAAVSSRAAQTSVDTIDDYIDTEMAATKSAAESAKAAAESVDAKITNTILTKITNSAQTGADGDTLEILSDELDVVAAALVTILTKLPSALVDGKMNCHVASMGVDVITVAATAEALVSWIQEDMASQQTLEDVLDLLQDSDSNSGGSTGGGVAGPGNDFVTVTIADNSVGVPDVSVWVSTDAGGSNIVAGTLVTDDSGQATFLLDAGVTYYLWARKAGKMSIMGQEFVAEAD